MERLATNKRIEEKGLPREKEEYRLETGRLKYC